MRISDWSSDVCSSDLGVDEAGEHGGAVKVVDRRLRAGGAAGALLVAGEQDIAVARNDRRHRLRRVAVHGDDRAAAIEGRCFLCGGGQRAQRRDQRTDTRGVGNEGVSTFYTWWSRDQ